MLCFPGLPPVDAALWRRLVGQPAAACTFEDYARLPAYYQGVIDRRRQIEAGERPSLPKSTAKARAVADALFADVAKAEALNEQRAEAGLPPKHGHRVTRPVLAQVCADIRAGRLHPHRINFNDHMLILAHEDDRAALSAAIQDWLSK